MTGGTGSRHLYRLATGSASLLLLIVAPGCAVDDNAEHSGARATLVQTQLASGPPGLRDDPGVVSINCGTRRQDHEVYMTARNSGQVDQICTATCYYRDSRGEIGSLTGTQRIPTNATELPFASRYDPALTFQVINPGMADCSSLASPVQRQP
jgi:hypothetical protein